jgi:hypothetical protein
MLSPHSSQYYMLKGGKMDKFSKEGYILINSFHIKI